MMLLTAFSFHSDPQELTLLLLTPSDTKFQTTKPTKPFHFERLLKKKKKELLMGFSAGRSSNARQSVNRVSFLNIRKGIA